MGELGKRIEELRLQEGWKAKHLAELAGVTNRTIERIESGESINSHDYTLESIARAFNGKVDARELKALRDKDLLEAEQTTVPTSNTNETVANELDTIPELLSDEAEPIVIIHNEEEESDAPQLATITSDTSEAVVAVPDLSPEIPSNKAESTIPKFDIKHQHRHKRIIFSGAVVLLCLVLITASVFVYMLLAKSQNVAISGQVSCVDNLRVAGVWITADKGVSGMANTHKLNPSGTITHFAYTLSQGGAYNVHVGCGNTGDAWLNPDDTEYGSGKVTDYKYHEFVCQDTPLVNGNGRCYLTK